MAINNGFSVDIVGFIKVTLCLVYYLSWPWKFTRVKLGKITRNKEIKLKEIKLNAFAGDTTF